MANSTLAYVRLCAMTCTRPQGVQDDGVNLLVMRAGVVAFDLACELADAFVQASYLPASRSSACLRDAWRVFSSTSETI